MRSPQRREVDSDRDEQGQQTAEPCAGSQQVNDFRDYQRCASAAADRAGMAEHRLNCEAGCGQDCRDDNIVVPGRSMSNSTRINPKRSSSHWPNCVRRARPAAHAVSS